MDRQNSARFQMVEIPAPDALMSPLPPPRDIFISLLIGDKYFYGNQPQSRSLSKNLRMKLLSCRYWCELLIDSNQPPTHLSVLLPPAPAEVSCADMTY